MSQHVDAIYVNGVLKPVVPLPIPDNAHVKITIDADSTSRPKIEPQDEWERQLLGLARNCGVSLPDSAVSSEVLNA